MSGEGQRNDDEQSNSSAVNSGFSKAWANRAFGAIKVIIINTLRRGDSVAFLDFGFLLVREQAFRVGRNPIKSKR